jgi:hypothetical protein
MEKQPADPNIMPFIKIIQWPELIRHIINSAGSRHDDQPNTGGGPALDEGLYHGRDVTEVQL